MTDEYASDGNITNPSSISQYAAVFFGSLEKDESGRKLLAEQDHCIEFDLLDGNSFYVAVKSGNIMVHDGIVRPRSYDSNDVIHFQLQSSTLRRLFGGKIRFTDALTPTNQDANDAMILLECTLFKWSVLNWVGRMFRGAQTRGSGI